MAVVIRKDFFRIAISFAFVAFAGCQSDDRVRAEPPPLLPGKGITIYAAGDIADCEKHPVQQSGAAQTAVLIAPRLAADKDAIVLTLGDHTYPVGLLSEFTDCYDPTWGKFKARTYPAPGNHEYYTPQAAGYYGYFGEAAGAHHHSYRSFDIGGWHIVSLNSYLKPNAHRKQMEWLKADLAQNKARCTLVYWHHPMYTSGVRGGNAQMEEAWKMLYEAGAELVLTSHEHHYERFAPQNASGELDEQRGMRQFVVGTGGAKLSSFRSRHVNSEVTDNSTHGVLKLVLKGSGYEWEFLPTEKGGFTDRGMTLCH
jgi:acid phosphatase type 7